MPDAIRHLTLDNGLRLVLRHAPRLKRCAAALRVHAGSHDAPERWPGMAHFLEHLFFLGTTRFPLEDGLMRYVQSQGGQINASTRERTTDFFFEVAPAALAGGLERLCQMLAEPDLGIERQHREREVIHAEFIAWSRNPEAQRQFARLQSVSARHPLAGFHAGNRHSLALRDPAFQRALRHFHTRYYQGGQMVLSLCGPQSLDQLEALAREHGALLPSGGRIEQSAPPPLEGGVRTQRVEGKQVLLFVLEGLPEVTEQALELLDAWLGDNRPGGWLGEMRRRGWLRDFSTSTLYSFAGQLLWQIQLQLSEQACEDETLALLQGWLGFIRQLDPQILNDRFADLQLSREQAAGALELARRDSGGLPMRALDHVGIGALQALLSALPTRTHGQWRLPPPEPLLLAELPEDDDCAWPTGLTISDDLPVSSGFASLHLRWRVDAAWCKRFEEIFEHSLRALKERAERASVQLRFGASGEYWQLRYAGRPAAVIRATEEALALLRAPAPECWKTPATPAPALIPIRALLTQLPETLQGFLQPPQEACAPNQALLDETWRQARWHGLAVGFDPHAQRALSAALQALPGQHGPAQVPDLSAGRQWRTVTLPGSEHALLLFMSLPPDKQAAGRLLAQLWQGPVYRLLRVELQLGYAVFSAFRQIEGYGGLLFGVQSPHASPREILGHLLELLSQPIALDPLVRQTLSDQFAQTAMTEAEMAEWAWQTELATCPQPLAHVRQSILLTDQDDLDDLQRSLLSGEYGWLCLANAPEPDAAWN
ncbi:pyrroloquinoline quinone biosynthesis protein PqqF [Pseudomonas capeferrum]|uniref:pyrroloquinoline quinone biosynthesis protein PqqF n=1 Tax=Pseudomonas capeferrum TaxID=1495066 RepID=UPI0015E40D83|nr:pyrroloquinoline quinone biosynthesis protein PqqF [Pseudomonas capeferrum]MBA1201690.1 pyrroloquinoline quinone biosynthesis protein PqqF [Pseudomonas capeferrum]